MAVCHPGSPRAWLRPTPIRGGGPTMATASSTRDFRTKEAPPDVFVLSSAPVMAPEMIRMAVLYTAWTVPLARSLASTASTVR